MFRGTRVPVHRLAELVPSHVRAHELPKVSDTLVTAIAPEQPFTLIARPTPVQQRARDLLGLSRTQ